MMITSLLDTDLYKFTMMQVVLHHFPAAQVEYRFKCRNAGIDLRPHQAEIQRRINALANLTLSDEELDYLAALPYIQADFIEYLRYFRLNPALVRVQALDALDIVIEGPWFHTILFEVPILSLVNEIYFREYAPKPDWAEGEKRLAEKIELIKQRNDPGFLCSDFGTRRRFSGAWQAKVVQAFAHAVPDNFVGTSNVKLAQTFNLPVIGTMAHEFLQAGQALSPRLVDSQRFALETWVQEYRGQLGIALSDVCGMDAFLRDFDAAFAKLYDGARHDSGDPIEWGEKLLKHYAQLGIDAKQKTLVFSDGLSVPSALAIYDHFKQSTNPVFGIGTNLTNDLGYTPLQIVIKMTRCNGQPVAKISDSAGKLMCQDAVYLQYLRQVFALPTEAL